MDKKQVIKHLETIAVYLELNGENAFKTSAYRKAAQALERDDRSLGEIDDFSSMNGIGKGTNAVILEFIENGETETLNELKKKVPEGLVPLLKIQGLGGKKLAKLYQELGVIDEATLRKACENGEVEELGGFGKKSVEKILKALDDAGTRPERLPIADVLPVAEEIERELDQLEGIDRYSVAGSLRRLKETAKDIDFIIATKEPEQVSEQLTKLSNVKEVVSHGETKVTVVVSGDWNISVDFRLIEPEHFITTLHHFTGSKDHNVEMRGLAKQKGYKISEYGIENLETEELHTFNSEKEFFEFLEVPYLPPEVRETGEEVGVKKSPSLIELSDIRGDLHMHTTWSDGAQSIDEMIEKCVEYEYDFMAITDHSKFLQVANGLNEDRLRKQREAIQKASEKYPSIHVLCGIEMDILPNGELDFSDEFLKEMDFVIASIHSSFNQSEDQIMKRMKRAMECPYVDMIAHPTGRLLGRRKGYPLNTDEFIDLAVETDTIIELNANPNRLDLSWELLHEAQERGAKIAINTDAHNYKMLSDMRIGVQAARKGWLKKENIVNAWSKDELISFLDQKKGE
ncbi:DNA polymerase/3'-5' exonuclease PolX [Halalkalibacillus sediminis]|uniref:DNA-directed DNA polymerase n=1 Tax=Halalkalibacillus sediminis TaxID=2018042 RepID=A0A2I0QY20_9BACI|nr:DNA polymerase/3'-5' exonuclease PolX [Halalkalibacillus sediminis]PKR79234.1 DNA polymerase/3'-5' exonuclease PolX [Halalkalibacillus sediminis]